MGRTALRPLLWRLHFLGGVLAAPIVLSLAVTGILFAWNPQIEQALHGKALTAVADGPARPLSQQVAAATTTHPDWTVSTVTPAAPQAPGGEQTTGVTLTPPETESDKFDQPRGVTTVYVDPASARVTGSIVEANRPEEWLRNLHSSWRLGTMATPLTELAASWVLVSLLTGLYLWWPRSRRALRRTFRFRRPGRARWRSLHGALGAVFSAGLALLVVTGLTWTEYAGSWIDLAKFQFRSDAPAVSTQLAAAPATEGEPAEQSDVHTTTPDPLTGIDRVATTAEEAGLRGVVELEPPKQPGLAWTAGVDDNRWPVTATSLAVDPDSGEVTDRVGWDDYPVLAKATTLGIDFHQAQLFGTVNRIGLTVLAAALIVLVLAGYRTWWLRRPSGGLGVPPRMGPLLRTAPLPLLLGFGLLMVALPLLAVSFLVYLLLERLGRTLRGPGRRTRTATGTGE
ncbi:MULTISPECIES: PepSY domain-containing protein [unclassified Actinopolyspora]|uniref:PepSY domain-containing protein n=1 Tax=unclassified Actinopolyspora TaxID=2639451 RepID=UPI0013F66B9A|nr:PepSY domain-containing protein [Actinopolyspora sp. BKK2]NHE74624.1 PepSY domain-containing protein [Actinopolyspora sp. BKK1]